MSRTKYIVGEMPYGSRTILNAIVFPECRDHSSMRHLFEQVRSAGFVSFGMNKDGQFLARCRGESVSLNVKSNPERDSRLVNQMLGLLDNEQ